MTAVPTALPFGMRDCKIYPYVDAQGTILAATGYDLPNAQTFSFADTENFTDLRGDDDLVATHGEGAQVKWTLEAGGMELNVWAIFTGGQIIEEGVAPTRTITLRKCSDDARPYFHIVGQIMSDSGGDIVGKVYRAKCNGDISGQFGDGKFFVTSANGIGLPIPGTRLLYDIIQNETQSTLTTTPDAIPVPSKDVTVTITGAPAGGTFTLTFLGNTTGNIAYNATAATVKAALVALDDRFVAADWDVTGDAGGPYSVSMPSVGALTASGAGLTGGTNPAVAVS